MRQRSLVFLSLLISQCAHVRSSDTKQGSNASNRDQRATAEQLCGDAAQIWDPSHDKCVPRKTYCQLLKDGSVWDEKNAKCLSALAQCQMRADGSTWLNNKCMTAQEACAFNQQTWENDKCLTNLDACTSKGKNWTLSPQGICELRSFDSVCQNRSSDAEVDKTLNILQGLSYTNSCTELSQWLSAQRIIRIRSEDGSINITDLSPLIGLTGLVELYVDNNSIGDLTPLSNLSSLRVLDLENNKYVSDLFPLRNLTQLEELHLGNNAAENIVPLKNLTKLRILDLWQNHISDVTALQGLTALTELQLRNNAIQDASPLKGLSKLKLFSLDYNPIADPKNRTASNCPTDYAAPELLRKFCAGT